MPVCQRIYEIRWHRQHLKEKSLFNPAARGTWTEWRSYRLFCKCKCLQQWHRRVMLLSGISTFHVCINVLYRSIVMHRKHFRSATNTLYTFCADTWRIVLTLHILWLLSVDTVESINLPVTDRLTADRRRLYTALSSPAWQAITFGNFGSARRDRDGWTRIIGLDG